MKFAQNRLYIESYSKCQNCGILLYERPANSSADLTILKDGKTYCSAWCIAWEDERAKRHEAAAQARQA